MKKTKIVFLNRAHNLLYVEVAKCGKTDICRLQVKRRKVLKLIPARHELSLGYADTNLEIVSGRERLIDMEEIPSKVNKKCNGKRILVSNNHRTLKLKCEEAISVATLLEKLA